MGDVGMSVGENAEDSARPAGRDPPERVRRVVQFLPVCLLAAGAVLAYVFGQDYLGLDMIARHRDELIAWRDGNMVTAVLAYCLVYIVAVAFSVPGAIWLTTAGGFLFGTALAAGLTVVSATIGATLIFLAARSSLGALLHARAGPWLRRVEAEVAQGEISFLLVMRLVPAIPFFIANLAPAFVNVRLPSFVWTTLVGIAPATVVISSVGAGLGRVLDEGGEPNLGVIFEPHVLLPLLGLAALAAAPVLLRKLRGR